MQCCFFCMCRNHTHLCIAGGVENRTENPAMLASGVVYKHLYYMPNKKFLTFLGQGSYYLDQDSKILDQHCKNALDILARLQDAVLNMASFAISSPRDL